MKKRKAKKQIKTLTNKINNEEALNRILRVVATEWLNEKKSR